MPDAPTEQISVVGVDACVLVEGVLFDGTGYPSARVFAAAKKHIFAIWLVEQVEDEARRALRAHGREGEVDRLLGQCLVIRCPDPSETQWREHWESVWSLIRDEPDARIAVAIKCAPEPRPSFFVSSNRADWRPSTELHTLLRCCVMRTKTFANRISPDR